MTQSLQMPLSDVWRWSSQSAVPPNNGQVRSNTAEWSEASQLYIANLTDAGTDLSASLAAIAEGQGVYLQHKNDSSRFAQFQVTAASLDCGTYFQVGVTYQTGGGTLPNSGTQIIVDVLPSSTDGGTTAVFSLTQSEVRPTIYVGTVNCIHGETINICAVGEPGMPTPEDMAMSVFANHVALTACDCTLEVQP